VLELFGELKERHLSTAKELQVGESYLAALSEALDNLESILKGLTILEATFKYKVKAKILYFGEIFSSILVAGTLARLSSKTSRAYLSKDLLMCQGLYLDGECDFEKSEKLFSQWIQKTDLKKEIPVLTGFG
jgi:aspartokinase